MARNPQENLSRRERQIMQIIYRCGRATATEVRENLPDPPSYSAVRALLRVLEEKGHLRHQQDGPRYIYSPTVSLQKARRSALQGILHNFFANSHEQMIATLLDDPATELSASELDRLARMIEKARQEGR